MGNTTPNKFLEFRTRHLFFALLILIYLIIMCSGFKLVNRSVDFNKRNLKSRIQSSRLETNEGSSGTENSGSIFDDQEVVIESSKPKTESSSEPAQKDIGTNSNSNPSTQSTSSSQDERLSHMISITEPEKEVNKTIAEEPKTNASITTEDPKPKQNVVTKYITVPSKFNYVIKPYDSDVIDDVYPSETKDMVTYGVELFSVTVGVLLFVKLLVVVLKNFYYFQMPDYKMKAVHSFLKDLTIFIFIYLLINALNFHHYLDFIHTNIVNIIYGFGLFIIIWVLTSIILLYTSYLNLRKFFEFESVSKDISKLNDLKRFYEELWMNDRNIHSLIKEQIQFQIMRQSFINPIELPVLTECFLRRDFNFTIYLGYCISDYLGEVLGFINLKLFLTLLKISLIYRELTEIDDKPQNAIFYSFPLIMLFILFVIRWHLRSVYSYLVPEVSYPEHINFHVDLDIRDPFDHYDNLQIPPYLEKTTSDDEDEQERFPKDESESEEEESEFEVTKKPKEKPKQSEINNSKLVKDSAVAVVERERKSINKWMFKSGKRCFCFNQSRHQRLFCCGRLGLFLIKFIIQACYISTIVWLCALIVGNGFHRFYVFDEDIFDIILMVFCILVSLFTILYLFPTVVFIFALNTSIQMMKKREYIETVIKEQKHKKSQRSMRMYQVFKLIRRELIEYFKCHTGDKNLRNINVRIIRENYEMLKDYDKNELSSSQINDFYPLCGTKLKKLESYLLLKKAKSNGDSVKFRNLMDAISQTTNDVKIDPYDVVSTIFLLLLKEKDKLSMNDIESFFAEYEGYFEKEDVDEFLDEILSLQRESGLIDVQEIASLIRDDIR